MRAGQKRGAENKENLYCKVEVPCQKIFNPSNTLYCATNLQIRILY